MTSDMWTDNYRRRCYITFTLHFCDSNYELQDLTLKTELFDLSHSGENIRQAMDAMAEKFNLLQKKLIYITDNGSNIVKACKLAKVERNRCIAHALHNLITHDGIATTSEIQEIVSKARELVKTFTCKTEALLKEADKLMQEKLQAELCTSDEATAEDPEVQGKEYGDDPITGKHEAKTRNNTTSSTTLKKECPTR